MIDPLCELGVIGEAFVVGELRFGIHGYTQMYVDRIYYSSSVGNRIVEVTCDHCEFKYYYELARIGSGVTSSPYGIGGGGASNRSLENSQDDLARRLELEAELVPCPKCHWVNDDLIDGYRQNRYREWAKWGWSAAALLALVCLLMAGLLMMGPQPDLFAACLFGLLAVVAIGMGGLVIVVRNWLRRRINPNETFPDPPRLPRGCPRPLIWNAKTRQFDMVSLPIESEDEPKELWIDHQIGRSPLPMTCATCLGPAESNSAYQRRVLRAVSLSIPGCSDCTSRRKQRFWMIFGGIAGAAVATGVMASLLITSTGANKVVGWCYGSIGTVLIALWIADRMTSPVLIKPLDKSRGLIQIRFRNRDYQRLVIAREQGLK